MSYQVLARKWRPKTFEELAGQEHVLRALVNALENGRLHHAYLFTGTRGVGKTTIARILARSLNCETGTTARPCGTCSACQEINEGRFVDLIEVDAASRTKVEDTRELLENIQYMPTRGRFKIYLIDEVHMLSPHSFNALLKTLEEPPEHVKFLLATTDPQKLPVTVLSRCLQFNLKNLTTDLIKAHLECVLAEENVPAETGALWHLARTANGSMRDALSLTDQAISHGGGRLTETDVTSMLGTVDRHKTYEIMDALADSDAPALLAVADALAEFSPDYQALIRELLNLIHAVALYQMVPEAALSDALDQERIAAYATRISPEEAQLYYQMLLLGQKDLSLAPDMHVGFEMLLLRLLAFQPGKPGEKIVPGDAAEGEQDQAAGEEEDPGAKKPELQSVSVPAEVLTEAAASQHGNPAIESPGDAAEDTNPVPDPESVVEPELLESTGDRAAGGRENSQSIGSTGHNSGSGTADQLQVPASLAELVPESWTALFEELPVSGMLKSLCAHLALESVDGEQLHFILTEPAQKAFDDTHAEELGKLIGNYFGSEIRVAVRPGESDRETPVEYSQRRDQEKLEAAEVAIMHSPVVRKLVEEFQAELVAGSVHLKASAAERS